MRKCFLARTQTDFMLLMILARHKQLFLQNPGFYLSLSELNSTNLVGRSLCSILLFSEELSQQELAAIRLRNNLANELTIYANSPKAEVNKTYLVNNWMAHCNAALSKGDFYIYNLEELMIVFIISCLFALVTYFKNSYIDTTFSSTIAFYLYNLHKSDGQSCFFSTSPRKQLEELKESMQTEMVRR